MGSELITLDGQPLTGFDRDGTWKVNELLGWWDTPPVKRDSVPRPRGDGDYRTPVFYGPRQITIRGRVSSRNHDYLHQAAGRIAALGFRGGATMLVRGHGVTQSAKVDPRPGSGIKTTFETDKFLRFEIPLESIDPFKYGEEHTVAGSSSAPAALFHRGTVPAWPVVTVSGYAALSGYTLTLNGRKVVVTRAAGSANLHTIDFRTGVLRVGGVVERGGFAEADFSPVNPGLPQNMSVTLPSGSATFSVRYHDTYI